MFFKMHFFSTTTNNIVAINIAILNPVQNRQCTSNLCSHLSGSPPESELLHSANVCVVHHCYNSGWFCCSVSACSCSPACAYAAILCSAGPGPDRAIQCTSGPVQAGRVSPAQEDGSASFFTHLLLLILLGGTVIQTVWMSPCFPQMSMWPVCTCPSLTPT